MQRPQPRKRAEEGTRRDFRPFIGSPGQQGQGSQPCRYFANGSCARGDKCWFSHDPQASIRQFDPPSPRRPFPAPEKHKPDPERQSRIGQSDSGNPGQQQFIKRMLADLVTQKAGRAASNQEDSPSANSSQTAFRDNMHPAIASSTHESTVRNGLQQSADRHSMPPGNHSRHNGRDLPQNGPRHRAPFLDTNSIPGSDRTAPRQQKVPFVPVVPETDSRYRTILCMYHQQGRCPRGGGCSFAQGLSELRRKPKQQVQTGQTPSHAAGAVSSASADGEASEVESFADAVAQPDSTLSAAASLTSGAQPAEGHIQQADGSARPSSAGNAEQESAKDAKKQHESLPPIIQQLLSETANHKPPGVVPAQPESSRSQAESSAPSAAPETLIKESATPQFGTMSPQAPSTTQGFIFSPLFGDLPPQGAHCIPQSGSMSALPPPEHATDTPQPQGSVSSIVQPQPIAEQPSPSRSLPSAQTNALLQLGTPESNGPAEEHSTDAVGHSQQPESILSENPAEQTNGAASQSVQMGSHDDMPAAAGNGDLQPQQPEAIGSTVPKQAGIVHRGSVEDPHPHAPKTEASVPAVQRPQPLQRQQPERRPYVVNGSSYRPQPSNRLPPPGFNSRPFQGTASPHHTSHLGSQSSNAQNAESRKPYALHSPVQQPRSSVPASAARVSDGNHPGVQSSTQNSESWRPHEPQVQHLKSSEPVKAADAGKVQGPAGIMLPGSRAPSDRTDRSTSTYLSGEVLPEAVLSPKSTSSYSSSMQHSQSAANGNVQPSTACAHAAGSVAQSNASHGAPTKQVQRKLPANSGDEDDIPDSFCCPITQELMRNPVVTADGHSYEASAIASWLESHDTSPMTNEEMTSKIVAPNKSLKAVIDLLFPVC